MNRHNVLISLKPSNTAASEIVNLDSNRDFVHEGEQVLDLGQYSSRAAGNEARYIATIGRDGDIVLPPKWPVSRVQCAFLVGETGSCIIFVDNSSNASCQAYGSKGKTQELLSNSPRQVDSSSGFCKIAIRIDHDNEMKTAEFDVLWHHPTSKLTSALQAWRRVALPRQPRLADTQLWPAREDSTKTQHVVVAATDYQTSAGDLARFKLEKKPIGTGAFGAVYKACDPKNPNMVIAVKVLRPLNPGEWKFLDQEREILRQLRHPNIVEYFGDKVDSPRTVAHIFMSLQCGSLQDLIGTQPRPVQLSNSDLAWLAYRDILKGLDYLHQRGFIHRDLKPGNVLYILKNDRPFFCLADFGLAKSECFAQSFCGSPQFMAPEVFQHQEYTVAVDMWSLLMTILRTLDLAGYRARKFNEYWSHLEWVISTISDHWDTLGSIHELAVIDSRKRATAAQMLVKNFQGDGLTTDKQKVPELLPVNAPDIRDLPNAIFRYRRTKFPAGINRAPLQPGAFKWPAKRQNLFERKPVQRPQMPAKPEFCTNMPQRRDLFTIDILGRGGERKVVPEENAARRHPAARVAQGVAAAKPSIAPKESLPGQKPSVTQGVQKRKAPRAAARAQPETDPWFETMYRMPGAFPA
ncbi:uncharacterized protein LMH87_007704 [Akanthomyces muscarius]|uniref:non-specific serine/threonine protein kinase n=1 Tax=Akanthomyces muscarius TaxID=2231603 RepID=A0A9W8URE2_AKAMU|nr:uncharacterized protein LMH87_007704 [Akanthomyces muscarius]KAJ4161679.1 hypothetical protein LMH87_007704 [Akanthomyces muscarius]